MVPVIHAVTTDEVVARSDFVDCAAAVMRALGARGAVQLRAPRTAGGKLYRVASTLAQLQEATGAWLVVTDRVDVAAAAGARGVQLTTRSIAVADALTVAPGLAIGASVHSPTEAHAAVEGRATWLVVGQMSDGRRRLAGPRALRELIDECTVPVIVIGGVTPGHVAALRQLGAYGVAAIRGIWDAASADAAAAAYVAAYDATLPTH